MSRRQAQIRSERESRESEGRRWSLDDEERSDGLLVRRVDDSGKVVGERVLMGRRKDVNSVVTDFERWNMLEMWPLKGMSVVYSFC